jgi:chondroitin 4-sulfotransferase 11/chondroitin 4-sulfotransferase 13
MTTEQTLELFSDWGCPPYRSRIIVNEERKFLYCPIPKAACTAWKAALAGPNRPRDPQELHRKYEGFTFLSSLPEERFDAIKSSLFKFIFVRDPFSRLLASFKNKFENASTVPNNDPFWGNYGTQLKKHAIDTGLAEDSAPDLNFREFVRLVYRMKPATMNEHWHPQALLACVGEIDYDFIGHFERLADDVPVPLTSLGISSFPTLADVRQRPTNSSQLVDTYYDAELREMVREKYDIDFRTFGY